VEAPCIGGHGVDFYRRFQPRTGEDHGLCLKHDL
jgi:hypothetical protein